MRLRPIAVLVLSLTVCGSSAFAEDPGTLTWATCPPAEQGAAGTEGLVCTMVPVPMDHRDPNGPGFDLAVIKSPARRTGDRIGTLFWNPGGPSDSGTAYLPAAIGGFPDEVRDRFDIVSWDPRGMGGRTTPVVQCFASAEEEAEFLHGNLPDGLPLTPSEMARNHAGRTAFSKACAARAGDLLAHVSTADNARDLDRLRQAVGEETISYYGTSYGTFLGATYLNMFPDRVRAAVLDGAISPSAWVAGPGEDGGLSTFVRVGSDFAGQSSIGAFMDACGAVPASACAFSAGSPEATRAKWDTLLTRAAAGLSLDGDRIDDRDLMTYLGSSIYTVEPLPGFGRFPGFVAVALFLERLWQADAAPDVATVAPDPDNAANATPAAAGAAGATTVDQTYVTSAGRQLSVICGESPNPVDAEAIAAQIRASYARAGYSGWPLAASCEGWTARAADPYPGPWDRPTGAPVLVIGNSFDPATPFAGSVRMAQELADARLLVVHGFGHTVLINPSRCAQDYIAAYLVDGVLPPTGATCRQDRAPFPGG